MNNVPARACRAPSRECFGIRFGIVWYVSFSTVVQGMFNEPKIRSVGCAVLVIAGIVVAVHFGSNSDNSTPTPLFASGGGITKSVGKLPSSFYGSSAGSSSANVPPVAALGTPAEVPGQTVIPPSPEQSAIEVDVAGAVKHPGVYKLPPGARNNDALKAAGGATNTANTDAVNLAAPAVDGTQLYFPTKAEQPDSGALPLAASQNPAADNSLPPAVATNSKRSRRVRGGSRSAKLRSPSQEKVNVNTANAGQLERVPDIGPAMASRIIAFRQQNHGFASLKDLRNVKGIGPKKWAKMSPFLIVK